LAPALYAPATYIYSSTWHLSSVLFNSYEEAFSKCGEPKALIWPAPLPNKEGYYEEPNNEGDKNND